MFNQLVVIIEMLGGRIFPKAVEGRGFVEREGWEATAVSAVTGTNNCSHQPCNGMVCLVTQSKSLEVGIEESRVLARTKVTDRRNVVSWCPQAGEGGLA